MKKLILLLIVALVFTSSVAFASIENDDDVMIVEAISIEEIQSKLDINTLADTSSNQPELMLNTNIGSYQ